MKSVGIKDETHKELKKLSEIYGSDMGKFIADSVAYFKATGINPEDKSKGYTEELKNVKKEVNRLIGFQKTFEKEHLFPLFEAMKKAEINLSRCLPEESEPLATKASVQEVDEKMEKLDLKLNAIIKNGTGVSEGSEVSILDAFNAKTK